MGWVLGALGLLCVTEQIRTPRVVPAWHRPAPSRALCLLPGGFSRGVWTLFSYFWTLRPLSVVPSECSPGWYGRDCARPCQCKNGGRCDAATGMCHCPAGFIGADCGIGERWFSQRGWESRGAPSGGGEGWEMQTLPTEGLLTLWGMSSGPGTES